MAKVIVINKRHLEGYSKKSKVYGIVNLISLLAILGMLTPVGCVDTMGKHQLDRFQVQQYTMPDPLPGTWERYKPGSINLLMAKKTPQLLEEAQGFYLLPTEVPLLPLIESSPLLNNLTDPPHRENGRLIPSLDKEFEKGLIAIT